MKDVNVLGQPEYTYPSFSPNVRTTSESRNAGIFDDGKPTYLVPGNFSGTFLLKYGIGDSVSTKPMNVYKHGKKESLRFQK